MTDSNVANSASHVFRVDQIAVPLTSRPAFLEQVTTVQNLLEMQKGFVRNLILENPVEGDQVNFLTLVEWEGPEFLDAAAAAVAELHRHQDFDRESFRARLGIKSEFATFNRFEVQSDR